MQILCLLKLLTTDFSVCLCSDMSIIPLAKFPCCWPHSSFLYDSQFLYCSGHEGKKNVQLSLVDGFLDNFLSLFFFFNWNIIVFPNQTSLNISKVRGYLLKKHVRSKCQHSPVEEDVCTRVLSRSVVSSSFRPCDCSPPGSSVHAVLQARILERLLFPSPGDLSDPGMEPKTPNGIKSTLLNPMKI